MNNQSELSLDDLSLLENNEIKNFILLLKHLEYTIHKRLDCRYKCLKRYIEKLVLVQSKEDIQILVDTADIDKDGKISLEDFKHDR